MKNTEPNEQPKQANTWVNLGETDYGSADDRPYLPLGTETTEKERRTAGADWFRFTLTVMSPNLPSSGSNSLTGRCSSGLRIYSKETGQLVEYTRGIDRQSLRAGAAPAQGANKFTTRVLSKGTYYLWVDACQPDYQLRTKLSKCLPI